MRTVFHKPHVQERPSLPFHLALLSVSVLNFLSTGMLTRLAHGGGLCHDRV